MKVLFQSYNTCCQNNAGGVQVRIRRIHDLLIKQGVQVDYFEPFSTKLEDYDVLHIFKLNIENVSLVQCAKQKGLKVVLSSIVNLTGGGIIEINRFLSKLGLASIYRQISQMLDMCDVIIVETKREGAFLTDHYKVSKNKIQVIPNGVDIPCVSSDAIFHYVPRNCRYILQVGLFDTNKNQLNVIRAMRGQDYNVLFIGGETSFREKNYFNTCKDEARGYENIHFLGWVDPSSDILASAYQNAQALVFPSFQETFGLVAIEAAITGCHVCMSNTLPILDYNVFDSSLYLNPYSVNNIREILLKAMTMPKNDIVKNNCINVFSWPRVIEKHIMCYSK